MAVNYQLNVKTTLMSFCFFSFWAPVKKSQNLKGTIVRKFDLTSFLIFSTTTFQIF